MKGNRCIDCKKCVMYCPTNKDYAQHRVAHCHPRGEEEIPIVLSIHDVFGPVMDTCSYFSPDIPSYIRDWGSYLNE